MLKSWDMYFLNKLNRFSLDLRKKVAGISSAFCFFPALGSAPFRRLFSLDRRVLKSVRPGAVAPLPVASGSHVCDRK